LRFAAIALLVYVGFLVLTYFGFKAVPSGFIPTQDQGYLIVFAQLPDGASLQRADEVRKQISEIARTVPGVAHTVEFAGFAALDGTNRNNAVTTFLPLTPFEERENDPKLNGFAILGAVRQKFAGIQDARVLVFPPPPVQGIGNAGGFKIQIQDRRGAGLSALQAATDQLIAKASSGHGMVGLFTSFRSQVPQLYLDIDRRKVETLDVPIESVFATLQSYLGSTYVNDFNFVNRTDQVNIQADARFRIQPESIGQLYTRNNKNQMVPLGTLMDIREEPGPDKVMHYNIYPSAEINGSTLPGVSSGQAIDAMQTLADQTLPSQFGYEWTELSLQEILAGNSALYVFPLCALFVFLVLAAQYESWSLPLAIILIVPMCLFAAISGVYIRGSDNNIFTQIGFVVLIGLACKNAILIVEFAKQQMDAGQNRQDAAIEASRLRLRPILMTSFAFTLGVFPLVNAVGPGSEMRQAIGTAVFSGMIGVTLFGIFMTPVFFSVIMKLFEGKKEKPGKGSSSGVAGVQELQN
jgi:hydrophobe/amphiphile efflux-1 (HAE1) family protein